MNFEDRIREAMGQSDDLDKNPSVYSEEHIDRFFINGLEPVGGGKSRHVYKIISDRFGSQNKGNVIKFARNEESKQVNKREFQTWMAVNGRSVEQYFCPIVERDADYRWIIMEFAEPLDSDAESHEFCFEVENRINVDVDAHRTNVGMHSSRGKVLIDYPWGGRIEIN